MVAVALVLVLVVRPLAGMVGLVGVDVSSRERAVVSFFGIRGIGSLYYLSHGLEHGPFAHSEEIWALVGFTVVVSIVVHGLSATPVIQHLEEWRSEEETGPGGERVASRPG